MLKEREVMMRQFVRALLFVLLVLVSLTSPHSERLAAQTSAETEKEALETFVPSEKLPADSAISFPVDI